MEGNIQQKTYSESREISYLPVYSKENENILYLKIEFIENKSDIIGAYHRFYIIEENGDKQFQLIPDDAHTYTLEYFDW